jgi:hypothetical protein
LLKDTVSVNNRLAPPPLFGRTGSGPLLPKPRALYEPFDKSYSPSVPNIFSSADDAYWKAVRQAAAPCFSMSNLKQVGEFVARTASDSEGDVPPICVRLRPPDQGRSS